MRSPSCCPAALGSTPTSWHRRSRSSSPRATASASAATSRARSSRPDGKYLPLVVLVHGGPYGVRDRWEFTPDVQALATRGYAVLQVNYRGSGGYGAKFERSGWGEWGRAMQNDLTDATRWAVKEGIADRNRLCIMGGSYGGYAALMGVSVEPDLYQCAIGYVGVYDLRLMKKRGDIPQSSYGKNYLQRVLGTDEDELARRSPVEYADAITAKVFLVAAENDSRVPPLHSERMRDALKRAGKAPEYLLGRGEGHGFYDPKNVEAFYERSLKFLDSAIGEKAGAGRSVSAPAP
ncbi:alpha/beta fold hydrolase [Paucibacter sp. O1-1]|nr:alpha/beta fold hydrolase [Paucibacter sp. O1-1]MDA3830880.1 alpha/beta fold hydrolase [Paucibacter sp. O1-1]